MAFFNSPRTRGNLSGYSRLLEEAKAKAEGAGFTFAAFTPFWYYQGQTEDRMPITNYSRPDDT